MEAKTGHEIAWFMRAIVSREDSEWFSILRHFGILAQLFHFGAFV
jgi:hypothetical protein